MDLPSPTQLVMDAFDHHAAGRLQQAHQGYREALRQNPDDPHAQHFMGVLMHQGGHHEQAEQWIRKALANHPDWPDPWVNLGLVLSALGRSDEAESVLLTALRCDDGLVSGWNNLGSLRIRQARYREALEALERAVDLDANNADAWYNQAVALSRLGRHAASSAACRRCLALQADRAEAWGQLADNALALGQADEAVDAARSGLAVQPNDAELHYVLGFALAATGQLEQARDAYRQTLVAKPDHGAALAALLFVQRQLADWNGVDRLFQRCLDAVERGSGRVTPFSLLAEATTREQQLAIARQWTRQCVGEIPDIALAADPPTDDDGRLTIGYLSADYYRHPTAYLAAGLFESHDRARFRVIAYSNSRDDGSAIRHRLEQAFDDFVDLRGLSITAAARRIAQDGVHILVDLKGHTLEAATGIPALRPAPVQIQYLGYPGTMGAPFIDYVVGDAWVTPPGHERSFDEHVIRLPDSYQVNDRARPRPSPADKRSDLGLDEGAFVYCCFNAPWKLNAPLLDRWCRILADVPDSVLWLLGREDAAAWRKNLRGEAQQRGIDPQRLVFARHRPLEAYLALYHHADLFLDTLPYNAHTTASDALWMACPVLTLPGDTFAGRVGASLLSAVDQPDLIARDAADYHDKAVAWARSPEQLAGIRRTLEAQHLSQPLFDTTRFTRHLESAYQQAWRHHLEGQHRGFEVRDDVAND